MTITLKHLKLEDLKNYQYWKNPKHAYHDLNGPYYKKSTVEEIEILIHRISDKFKNGYLIPIFNKKIITNENNEMLGEVNWYWKSEETNWMEIGIVIFDENNWGKGIGYQALRLWINELFLEKKEIIRLGLSTWSGNHGMMKLAEKLGMKKEAEYRKARIINGEYFDSVSYGILREEWEAQK